jgi:hypothetical protein
MVGDLDETIRTVDVFCGALGGDSTPRWRRGLPTAGHDVAGDNPEVAVDLVRGSLAETGS